MSNRNDYDLCVIGGGINGVGVAREAARAGLKVLLVEMDDLASATSSASTKLIHGGLRYLEYFEFSLVREALQEREVLLSMAPHIIWPMEFVLPYTKQAQVRPFWMIRAGLFLYDNLAKRRHLEASRPVFLSRHEYGVPLQKHYRKGFCYADCWVDDARLVVLNAMDAHDHGAEILTRTKCEKISEIDGGWTLSLRDVVGGSVRDVRAGAIVNAAGPWVRDVLDESGLSGAVDVPDVRLIKGSHIVVKQQYEGSHSYILQQEDGRVVFAIPYEDDFTLIGTTDVEFDGDASNVRISGDEIAYLCAAYNEAFERSISADDVVYDYSGVRPLFDDGGGDASGVTRDYHLHRHDNFVAPMVSIFGGKITTYRQLAQSVMRDLAALGVDGVVRHYSASNACLPGGEMNAQQNVKYQWLDDILLNRFLRLYGALMDGFLGDASNIDDLGVHYGDHVYEAELGYLIAKEWARSAEDVLWRRTKLGLHISDQTLQAIKADFSRLLKEYGDA